MRSMEGVVMDANRLTFPTELSPQKFDRRAVPPQRLPAPVLTRSIDAVDERRMKKRNRASKEHCPPEVYIG